MDNLDLREIILNIKEPHVLRNMRLPWKCFNMSFFDWCKLYDEHLPSANFEYTSRTHGNSPQWEKFRSITPLTFKNFYQKVKINDDKTEDSNFFKDNWVAFSYKNIQNMPDDCKEKISFNSFGFTGLDDDITFWLGSEEAHTPCHYDTYGCNIVVQVYGRKLWLLFPPTAKLTPIRIPYEESSVYCSEVFYSPSSANYENYEDICEDCYKCVLEPGDVLIVPNKWWHYVENLCAGLSINCWVPLEKDTNAQLDELIVRFIIENIILSENDYESTLKQYLNPNEVLFKNDALLNILQKLIENEFNSGQAPSKIKKSSEKFPYQYLSSEELQAKILASQHNCNYQIEKVDKMNRNSFYKILKTNSKRFNDTTCDDLQNFTLKTILINSICNPIAIKRIREEFLRRVAIVKKF